MVLPALLAVGGTALVSGVASYLSRNALEKEREKTKQSEAETQQEIIALRRQEVSVYASPEQLALSTSGSADDFYLTLRKAAVPIFLVVVGLVAIWMVKKK